MDFGLSHPAAADVRGGTHSRGGHAADVDGLRDRRHRPAETRAKHPAAFAATAAGD